METKHWRFTARETVGIVSVVVSIVLWSLSTFQSKTDARREHETITGEIRGVESRSNARIDGLENKMAEVDKKLNGVAGDTQYIRGRLEPKQ